MTQYANTVTVDGSVKVGNIVLFEPGAESASLKSGALQGFGGGIVVYGNVIPTQTEVYNLGAPGQTWKDLYVSKDSVHIGSTFKLTADDDATLNIVPTTANVLSNTCTMTKGMTVSGTGFFTTANVSYPGQFIQDQIQPPTQATWNGTHLTWSANTMMMISDASYVALPGGTDTYPDGQYVNVPAANVAIQWYPLPETAVTTWTRRNTGSDRNWRSVCWSPELGLFCAVANTGTGNRVVTSPDGTTWTSQTTPADNNWSSVCWSPELGLFCAVASSGTDMVMTSTDGTTWTLQTIASSNWFSVCWSPQLGLFCVIGHPTQAATSPDGITWTIRTIPTKSGRVDYQSVCWSPELGLFCATANSGTGERVITSPNGITWTLQTTPADSNWNGVCWSPQLGLFCALAQRAGGVMTSPDGIEWTVRTTETYSNGAWDGAICWSPELRLFCAAKNIGTTSTTSGRIMTSPDGINWTLRTIVTDFTGRYGWTSICWSSDLGIFCAMSLSTGTVLTNQLKCTANGIPIGVDDALYYRFRPGETTSSTINGRFAVVNCATPRTWTPDSNWALLAVRTQGTGTSSSHIANNAQVKFLPGGVTFHDLVGSAAPAYSVSGLGRHQPHMVHASATNGAVNNATAIPFTTVHHNIGSCWSTATFTVKIPGFYHLYCNLLTPNSTTLFGTDWYKNGTRILGTGCWSIAPSTLSGHKRGTSSCIIYADAGDTFQLKTGTASTFSTDPVHNYIVIYQVG